MATIEEMWAALAQLEITVALMVPIAAVTATAPPVVPAAAAPPIVLNVDQRINQSSNELVQLPRQHSQFADRTASSAHDGIDPTVDTHIDVVPDRTSQIWSHHRVVNDMYAFMVADTLAHFQGEVNRVNMHHHQREIMFRLQQAKQRWLNRCSVRDRHSAEPCSEVVTNTHTHGCSDGNNKGTDADDDGKPHAATTPSQSQVERTPCYQSPVRSPARFSGRLSLRKRRSLAVAPSPMLENHSALSQPTSELRSGGSRSLTELDRKRESLAVAPSLMLENHGVVSQQTSKLRSGGSRSLTREPSAQAQDYSPLAPLFDTMPNRRGGVVTTLFSDGDSVDYAQPPLPVDWWRHSPSMDLPSLIRQLHQQVTPAEKPHEVQGDAERRNCNLALTQVYSPTADSPRRFGVYSPNADSPRRFGGALGQGDSRGIGSHCDHSPTLISSWSPQSPYCEDTESHSGGSNNLAVRMLSARARGYKHSLSPYRANSMADRRDLVVTATGNFRDRRSRSLSTKRRNSDQRARACTAASKTIGTPTGTVPQHLCNPLLPRGAWSARKSIVAFLGSAHDIKAHADSCLNTFDMEQQNDLLSSLCDTNTHEATHENGIVHKVLNTHEATHENGIVHKVLNEIEDHETLGYTADESNDFAYIMTVDDLSTQKGDDHDTTELVHEGESTRASPLDVAALLSEK